MCRGLLFEAGALSHKPLSLDLVPLSFFGLPPLLGELRPLQINRVLRNVSRRERIT